MGTQREIGPSPALPRVPGVARGGSRGRAIASFGGALLTTLLLIGPGAAHVVPNSVPITRTSAPYLGNVGQSSCAYGGCVTTNSACAWYNETTPPALDLTTGKGALGLSAAGRTCRRSPGGSLGYSAWGGRGNEAFLPINATGGHHLRIHLRVQFSAAWNASAGTCVPSPSYAQSCSELTYRDLGVQALLENTSSGVIRTGGSVILYETQTNWSTTCRPTGSANCTTNVSGPLNGTVSATADPVLYLNSSFPGAGPFELLLVVWGGVGEFLGEGPGKLTSASAHDTISCTYRLAWIARS
jgi:hypothetical protein